MGRTKEENNFEGEILREGDENEVSGEKCENR